MTMVVAGPVMMAVVNRAIAAIVAGAMTGMVTGIAARALAAMMAETMAAGVRDAGTGAAPVLRVGRDGAHCAENPEQRRDPYLPLHEPS